MTAHTSAPAVARRAAAAVLHLTLLLALFLLAATPAAVQAAAAPICVIPVLPPPGPPSLTPWFYEADSGEYVWGEHQFYEDPGDTVFSLARDLVALGAQQPAGSYPDVLLFNVAQFDPPEGIDSPGPRRLMEASIEGKGLQLHVNYTDALIDPGFTDRYGKPTFFQSIDGEHENTQTNPTVPWSGFSVPFVSATRGAFGCAFAKVVAHGAQKLPAPPLGGGAGLAGLVVVPGELQTTCSELYVTAGLAYGLAELDPDPAQ